MLRQRSDYSSNNPALNTSLYSLKGKREKINPQLYSKKKKKKKRKVKKRKEKINKAKQEVKVAKGLSRLWARA
jgi:hypothetical protein